MTDTEQIDKVREKINQKIISVHFGKIDSKEASSQIYAQVIQPLIDQAKREVAREIFDWIRKNIYISGHHKEYQDGCQCKSCQLHRFESRYLGDKGGGE